MSSSALRQGVPTLKIERSFFKAHEVLSLEDKRFTNILHSVALAVSLFLIYLFVGDILCHAFRVGTKEERSLQRERYTEW